jgi:riboflavin synthase
MFTGIIEAVGKIKRMQAAGGDMRLEIATGSLDMSDVKKGDSIAVNGVCLTAIEHTASSFVADVSNETIAHTSLETLKPGSEVNLEKALLPTTRLGGHLVSGHVDGLGSVIDISEDARSIRLVIEAPKTLMKYIAAKGSICVDGTSLTVNAIESTHFELNIVPHTQACTVIKHYQPGTRVNLEVDLIARYLERLLLNLPEPERSTIDMAMLAKAGFVS